VPEVGARPKGPADRSPRVHEGPAAAPSLARGGEQLQGEVTRSPNGARKPQRAGTELDPGPFLLGSEPIEMLPSTECLLP
jgi:hypothetical protein